MEESNLEKILRTTDRKTLEELELFIIQSPEYMRLFRCTQMRDEVLRTDDDKSSNRGTHTVQVAENASILAKKLLKKHEKLSDDEEKQVLIAKIVGLAHDLGHTPMGHATEEILGNKLSYEDKDGVKVECKFKHDEYSGVIFSNLFEKFIISEFNR